MWTTRDGYILRLPRSVLRNLSVREAMTEEEVANEVGRLASGARRLGSFRARSTGRTFPVFRARSGPRSIRLTAKPMGRARSWPGPRGAFWPWAPTYAIVDVSSRFDDPYDDDPALPSHRESNATPATPATPPRRGVSLAWSRSLPLQAAARLSGGGVYIVEDPAGQPVYVGQTANLSKRLSYLSSAYPGYSVRVARASRSLDVLAAVGAAVLRAVRSGGRLRAGMQSKTDWGTLRGLLPGDNAYGARPPAGRQPLRIERTTRKIASYRRAAQR